ncbi:MAG: hypothetical protein A2054_00835 [Deltaproteobacteria bacterium GWA2_55_10]|nr:MAG: hypothetical protein A2054_00835 [Deltaproteobacteria bacterium GWA2_55_10]
MEIKSEILYNERLSAGYYKLGLSWKAAKVVAGHFVMLRVSDGLDPLLRRPFGIYRAIKGRGVELLYRVVGKGTEILSNKRPGERLGILGPLGNGFTEPEKGRKIIMLTGGMGIVPLYMLAESIESGTLIFGARSRKETFLLKDFRKFALKIKTATEDGSVGRKGLATDLLEEEITPEAIVYACGPMGMLKAAAGIAMNSGAKCMVSLERSMACGIGVCLGCAVKAKPHKDEKENRLYKMVCSDGPVFDSEDIDWDVL